MGKLYKVISDKYVETLVDRLNILSKDGWVIEAYLQEFGLTKFVISTEQKEKETN